MNRTDILTDSVSEAIGVITAHMIREYPASDIYKAIIAEVDRAVISTSLGITEGNTTKASELLTMNRGTFGVKRKKLNIDRRGVCK